MQKARLRISGLVRLANQVREQLSQVESDGQREKLRDFVQGQLSEVNQLLSTSGAHESSLPAPSRRALHFLRTIDWSAAASGRLTAIDTAIDTGKNQSESPAAQQDCGTSLNLPALSAFARRTLAILAGSSGDKNLEAILRSIRNTLARTDHMLRTRGVTLSQLTPPARAQFGLVALLASDDVLARYVGAVADARRAFETLAVAARCRLPLLVQFKPMPGLYRYRATPSGTEILLPLPMICFDAATFSHLAHQMFGKDRSRRPFILAGMQEPGYQNLQKQFDLLSGNVWQTAGAAHNLEDSFDRVNAAHFGGKMPRPRLVWSRTFTHRKMGQYQRATDTVQISISIDHPSVPASTLDFLMFHELLHKKHGTQWKNGRGYAHTAAFYADERTFPNWKQEEETLTRIAKSHAGR